MKRKGFLWVAGYAAFMIGYFLILTMLLPSTVTYEPDWIRVGNYAKYRVEDWGSYNEPIRNGTYTWRIVAVYHVDGRTVVRVNETYVGTSWWSHGSSIPPTGRVVDVDVREGVAGGLPLWFNRFYNDYLVDRSVFRGVGGDTFEGRGVERISVQGEARSCIEFTSYLPSLYRPSSYWYDKATGILLRYHFGFRFIQSDVLLKSTNISGELDSSKATLDLFLVSPLFVLPLTGATTGLFLLRRRGYGFSWGFWVGLAFSNGIILALVANWPLKISLTSILGFPWLGIFAVLSVAFWMGILLAAIFLINRFVFPIVAKAILEE